MRLHDAITVGITHAQQNRLRTGLSIIGILVGIASVLCVMAIGDGVKKLIADDIAKLGGPNPVDNPAVQLSETSYVDIFAIWTVSCLRFLVARRTRKIVYPVVGSFNG